MENYCSDLSRYEGESNDLEITINDSIFGQLNQSVLTINIKLKRKVIIPKQSRLKVKTKIIIDGPIRNFNMLVKKHKALPITGVLKTYGFISPWEKSVLKVVVQNTHNYDLR